MPPQFGYARLSRNTNHMMIQLTASRPTISAARAVSWIKIAGEFGAVQVVVQILLALTGLIVLRNLSKPQYGLYAIFYSMQSSANVLADLGVGMGLRSIGGKVFSDKQRFSELIVTALHLRRRFLSASFLLTLPVTAWMLHKNGASWAVTSTLCVILALGLLPQVTSAVLIQVPQLNGEYRRIQLWDLSTALIRLGSVWILAMASITAILATLANVMANWAQMFFTRSYSRRHVVFSAPPNADDQRQLVKLSLQWLPNVIFFCLQSQVTLLLLSAFGNVSGIADITALGRLAVVFSVLTVTFSNLVLPRFARCQDPKTLLHLYLLLLLAAFLLLTPGFAIALLFPSKVLWLLGSKYASLNKECAWIIGSACLGQLANIMWGLNSAKAWIRFQSILFIPSILIAQGLAVSFLNLRNFHDIVLFNLATTAAPISMYIADAVAGFRSLRNNS